MGTWTFARTCNAHRYENIALAPAQEAVLIAHPAEAPEIFPFAIDCYENVNPWCTDCFGLVRERCHDARPAADWGDRSFAESNWACPASVVRPGADVDPETLAAWLQAREAWHGRRSAETRDLAVAAVAALGRCVPCRLEGGAEDRR